MKRRGQTLTAVVLLVAAMLIGIGLLVSLSQNEARWAVKQERAGAAYHIAEAAQERAVAYLTASPANWDAATTAPGAAGYMADVAYSDIQGGLYSIRITSGPAVNQATIVTQGRDASTREVRSIKMVVSLPATAAAIFTSGATFSGGSGAQWGPISSNASLAVSGASDLCYPVKYAAGNITGMVAACHADAPGFSYSGTAPPCTDGVEWLVQGCSPGGPPFPTINLDAYRALAKASSCPTAQFPSGASPAGSCYWSAGQNPQLSNVNMAWTPETIFSEGDLTISNGCVYGSVLATGNLTLSGGGTCPTYTTSDIPADAWKQYQKIDTAAAGEYFGDAGYHQVSSSFTFNMSGGKTASQCAAGSNCETGTSIRVTVRGFVYVGTGITASGSSAIHGVLYSPTYISGFSGSSAVFFDPTVAAGMLYASAGQLNRVSWREVLQPFSP